MVETANQRFFIALAAIIVLVIGTFVGSYVAVKSGGEDIDGIIISLNLTIITLLLIITSFILQIREVSLSKKRGKK